jgi:hypothetical protein
VETGFRSVSLPIREATPPPLAMEAGLTLDALAGYVRTWSAVGRYITAHARDPVAELVEELGPLWGPPEQPRLVRWPLAVRAGRWMDGGSRA